MATHQSTPEKSYTVLPPSNYLKVAKYMLIFTLCAAMLIGFGSLQPDNLPLTFNNITLRISGESTEATISRAWRDSREPQNAKNKFYHVKYDFITNAGDTYSGKSFLDRKKSKRYSAGETIKVL